MSNLWCKDKWFLQLLKAIWWLLCMKKLLSLLQFCFVRNEFKLMTNQIMNIKVHNSPRFMPARSFVVFCSVVVVRFLIYLCDIYTHNDKTSDCLRQNQNDRKCTHICWNGMLLSGVPDLWDRNKILRSCDDLSHLHVPDCIWVFFYFVWFVSIHHNFQFHFESCTYCNILDIYLL